MVGECSPERRTPRGNARRREGGLFRLLVRRCRSSTFRGYRSPRELTQNPRPSELLRRELAGLNGGERAGTPPTREASGRQAWACERTHWFTRGRASAHALLHPRACERTRTASPAHSRVCTREGRGRRVIQLEVLGLAGPPSRRIHAVSRARAELEQERRGAPSRVCPRLWPPGVPIRLSSTRSAAEISILQGLC